MKSLISTDLGKEKWERVIGEILSVCVAVLATFSHILGVIMPLTGVITPRMKRESGVTPQSDTHDLLF